MQFISSEVVAEACRREPSANIYDPLIMAVDVARFGEDESSIRFRRGRDARSIPAIHLRGVDTMTLAGRVVQEARDRNPDAVFIDETGVGGGVVDRCRQLGLQVIGVNNGAKTDIPVEGELVANKGAECWARGRAWLKDGAIEDDPALRTQLESREYGFNAHNEIVLEKKDDMKKRGLASPDRADGLMLTFAYPVAQRTKPPVLRVGAETRTAGDWDPFAG
jgi:phage terminase large subunit